MDRSSGSRALRNPKDAAILTSDPVWRPSHPVPGLARYWMTVLHQIREVRPEQLALRDSVLANFLTHFYQNQLKFLTAQLLGLSF